MRKSLAITQNKRLKESGNVFLALFGAVAIVGVIGGTAAGIMKGPMKVMSDVSSRAVAENEIMANTKMGIMAIAQSAYTKDCDNDGTIEPYPFNSDNTDKTGGVPNGGGYLPSEVETTRWTDPWGNSYTYCVWDHGAAIDAGACTGENRLAGLDTFANPTGEVNKQTLLAVISAGANRRYETTCQDWASADGNADGDLDDIGDTPLVNKPIGSDDIVMSYTYAEAAMATSSNWRIQTDTPTTAEITEDEVEIGGQTNAGAGVSATIGGSVSALGGLKLATDPGDDSITGACNPTNDQALRINTGGASKALEICNTGAWTPISGSSTTNQCEITAPIIADGGNAWVQDATKLKGLWDINIVENYAYVTGFNGDSLTVIDISDPLTPVIANSGNAWIQDATKLEEAWAVEVVGNYAYVISTSGDSLTVIDISDPLNPVIANGGNAWIQDATKLNAPWDIKIVGNYAYIATYDGDSLTVIDISDPLNPVIANSGNAWIQDATKLNGASGIHINENYAYVTGKESNSLTVIDISDPLNPVIANAGNAWVTDAIKLDGVRDIQIIGNYAYVAAYDSHSFTVIDISDPLNPVIADSGNATLQDSVKLNNIADIEIKGQYALVASYTGDSFSVINIADPLNPVIADSGNSWLTDSTKLNGAGHVKVIGNYAFVASFDSDSVTVIDLGCDPTNPVAPITGANIGFDPELANCVAGNDGPFTEVGSFDTPDSARSIWSDGTIIYVADGSSGVRAYNFNGTAFTELGSFDTSDTAKGVWGDGTYIYVADGASGVRAYSFNGTAFTEQGSFDTSGNAQSVWGDGTYIYVADSASGVRAYSFNGTAFTEVGSFATPGNAWQVWGDGTYLYLADGSSGVRAYTFDGTTFTEVGSFDTPDRARSIWSDGTTIYVADGSSGVRAYIFDGTTFTELGSFATPSYSRNVWGDGTYLYLADGSSGVRAYIFDGTTFTELGSFDTPGEAFSVWGDGTYLYLADLNSGIRAYSGFECTKAGTKTPGDALEYDYTAEKLFESQTSAKGSAESYGTAILLKSNAFGDEAGFSVNVDSAIGDDETPSASITGARAGIKGEGALLFKTQNDEGNLNTNMMFDQDGDLGINTSAPFNVSGQIQIGDLASNGADYFNPELANCVANNGGPGALVTTLNLSSTASSIWGDGTYFYIADGTSGIYAYTYDGANFTLKGSFNTSGEAIEVRGDGTYIYVADGTAGLHVLTFDGTNFTLIDTYDTTGNASEIWLDGTYIYVGDLSGGATALSFNGTILTPITLVGGNISDIWGDGTYIYTVNFTGGINAYNFDGTTFNFIDNYSIGSAYAAWGDGSTIFVADNFQKILALSFDGSQFSLLDTYITPGNPVNIWGDGTYIYSISNDQGTEALTFDGETLSLAYSPAGNEFGGTSNQTSGVWGDGDYFYIADGNGNVRTYSGFECTAVDGWQGPTRGLLTSIGQGSCDTSSFKPINRYDSFGVPIDVWGDGTYIYSADLFALTAYTFDGTTLTQVGNEQPASPQPQSVWANGANIYTGGNELARYTFNGTGFTQAALSIIDDDPIPHTKPWGDGTYVYSGKASELWAHNPTTLDKVGSSLDTGANITNIWGDGTYIFTTHGASGIKAYTFNGTMFTPEGSFDTTGTASGVIGDGTYIYVADGADGVKAFTYDGTTFTLAGSYDTAGSAAEIWADGGYIYVADSAAGLLNLTFNGTNFTEVAVYDTTGSAVGVWGDGTYTYVADSGEIAAFPYFSCGEGYTGALGFFGQDGAGDTDTNIIFSQGLSIKGTNPDGSTLTNILSIDAQGKTTFEQGTLDQIDEGGAFEFLSSNSLSGVTPSLVLNRARGTQNSAAAVTTNDILGGITWAGYDGTGIASSGNAAIYTKALGAPSNGFIPNGLFFNTDNAGNALGSSDLALLSTGLLGVGTENPTEALHVAGRIAMTEGLRIGYDNQCNAEYDQGFIRYIASDNTVEYCTRNEWISINDQITDPVLPFNPEAGNCTANNGGPFVEIDVFDTPGQALKIWGDGTYIYVADNSSIRAYTFNGVAFTEVGSFVTAGNSNDIWGDGTYVYVADQGYLRAYSFNGTTFTELDAIVKADRVWGDGTYIYAGTQTDIRAFTFDGTSFTQIDSIVTPGFVYGVWGDGTYIYGADQTTVRAYTFDGISFIELGSLATASTAREVWGDGSYIYVTQNTLGIRAYTFDGTNFTEEGAFDTPGASLDIWGDGSYIYVADRESGIRAYTFDGTNFTEEGAFDTLGNASDVWGDGTYIFVADSNSGIRAFSGFECISTDPNYDAGHLIAWDGIENTELKITASDGAAGDKFGLSVNTDGQHILVGSPYHNSSAGAAYIFNAKTGVELFKLVPADSASADNFGINSSITSNYAIISAWTDDTVAGANTGSVYVFDITTGAELYKLEPSDAATGDAFGYGLASIGAYSIIGSRFDDDAGSNSGSAYIFNHTTGSQIQKIIGSDVAANDDFGISIAASENYFAIAASGDDDLGTDTGAVYVFDMKTRNELYKLTPSDGVDDDEYGQSMIAMNDNFIIIGAWGDDDLGNNAGAVYVYDTNTGEELYKLKASDGLASDAFGSRIAIDNHFAAIGSVNPTASGYVYIFDLSTGKQLYKIQSNDGAAGDRFGENPSISGNVIVTGATNDDDNGADSGSVYIYQGNWTDRYTSNTACYPDDLEFDNITNATASTVVTTNTITLEGFVQNCTLFLSSESGTTDILKNAASVGAPFVDVNIGDTIQLEISSSATAGESFNNIVTLGDKRAMFTVTTAP